MFRFPCHRHALEPSCLGRVLAVCLLLATLLGPQPGAALCLKDCDPAAVKPNYQIDTYSREGSHDMGNVKNSIVGDVTIKNGHERLEIKDIKSKETFIDASINSTVILGDSKK